MQPVFLDRNVHSNNTVDHQKVVLTFDLYLAYLYATASSKLSFQKVCLSMVNLSLMIIEISVISLGTLLYYRLFHYYPSSPTFSNESEL